MIVMEVGHKNYQQELQLLLLHFFSYLLIAQVHIELLFSCLISNLCVLMVFAAIDAVQSLCIDERNVLSSFLRYFAPYIFGPADHGFLQSFVFSISYLAFIKCVLL